MGVGVKLKRLLKKDKSVPTSKETGQVPSNADTQTSAAAGPSSSNTTATKQPPERAVSSAPISSNAVSVLPVASAQPKVSDTVALSPSDKFEPWTLAYEMFQKREPELMEDYKKHLASLQDLATNGDPSKSWSVESIVKQLLESREKKQWRVSLLGKEVKMREQSEKLAKFLLWSSPIVQSAVSTQPYAALAWSGVSLLLPLLTSSTTGNEAMLKGFNSIGETQAYWEICEKTYLRPSNRDEYQDLMGPLVRLYSHIVEYQARAICHLSTAQLSRAWQNVAGWSDWDGKIAEIDTLSKQCSSRIQPLQVEETRRQWNTQMQEMQTSQKFLSEIWTALEASKKQAQMNYEDRNERALLQDLASNYRDYKDFNPPRVQGTCEWFFADDRFCNWRDNCTYGLLWVSAGPGCGKSVLSRALIDERRLSTHVTTSAVCHFFFKDEDERCVHPTNALCAILHQLFTHDLSGSLIQHGLTRHRNHGKNLVENFNELWGILIDCSSSLSTGEIVCVIDALDECEQVGRRQLIGQLKEFSSACSSNPLSKLKFLITSRPYHDIETSFKRFPDAMFLHFDGDHKSALIKDEINLVIDARVNEIACDFEEADRQMISKKLKSMRQRTYLWLYLTFNLIESSSAYSKRSDIEALLSSLPSEVSEAYEKILERSQNQLQTETLLQVILAAARPLTLDEANEALTLALQSEDVTSYSDLKSQLWPKGVFESTVKNLCGLFISVYDSKLSFIHQTTREFLTYRTREGNWKGRLTMFQSHKTMTRITLRYLSLLNDQRSKLRSNLNLDTEPKTPLAQYSAKYWMVHARPVETEKDIQESMLTFFFQHDMDHTIWCGAFDPGRVMVQSYPWSKTLRSPLYYASAMNLPNLVGLMLDTIPHIKVDYGGLESPIQRACYEGHKNIVQLLLSRGANVNAGRRFGTALQIASKLGHVEIAQLLVDNGADVNARSETADSALQAACSGGHIKIVKLLLDRDADTNAQSTKSSSPFQIACYDGHLKIMRVLFEKGKYVNVPGGPNGSALQAACYKGHVEITRLLLDNSADVNAQGGPNGNALQAACRGGHIEIVRLLLDNGADVNSRGGRYYGALKATCHEGYVQIIRLISAREAGVASQGAYGRAFEPSYYQDRLDIVRLLLERGADVNAQGKALGSVLQYASCLGHTGIVQLLLDNRAEVNAQGGTYGNALQTACFLGHIETARLLLRHDAEINAQGGMYGNALQASCWEGDIEVVQLLLDNGADVNAQGGRYGTCLQAACCENHIEVVRLLLDNGANVNAKGELYPSALKAASELDRKEIAKLLLERGATPLE